MPYLEIQVEDVHLVHVPYPLTDLLHEQDGVQLCQVAVFINDAIKQLLTLHTAEERGGTLSLDSMNAACVLHEVAAQVPVALAMGLCVQLFPCLLHCMGYMMLMWILQYTLCLYLQCHTTKASKSLPFVPAL